jgi:hypothetical protein
MAKLFSLTLLLFLAGLRTGESVAPPAEEYGAIQKEYETPGKGFRDAKTDVERKLAVEHMDRFPRRFVKLAEKYPNDPIALEALTQAFRIMNSVDSLTQTAWDTNQSAFPAPSKDNAAGEAAQVLLRDHIQDEKLGLTCERMRYGVRKEYESCLLKVLQASPHKDVRGIACLSLADFLNAHLVKLDLIKERPALARRYRELLGPEYFDELQRRAKGDLAKEIETRLEQAATEFTNVKMPYGGTVGDQAKAKLFELRRLAIGKEIPDIAGHDQDGKQFRLSDYRSKVVLLYFWSEY